MFLRKNGYLFLILAVIVFVAVGCGSPASNTPQQPPEQGENGAGDPPADGEIPEEAVVYTDGVYEGSGQGYNGEIILEVTVAGGAIVNIEIVDSSETDSIGGAAYAELTARALEAQDFTFDAVSGATKTTQGFSEALENALSQASR
ncbi:MAG: FMN-binding protein [Clostridiales bacterium]|nr:FMN-binding protein [Clostridiales bacterium]